MVGKQKRGWKPAWIRKELLVGSFRLERRPVLGGGKWLQSCLTLLRLQTRLLCPWDFPGKNTGEGCHSLLQGIFPTQGWSPCIRPWQTDSVPLSHQGKVELVLTLRQLFTWEGGDVQTPDGRKEHRIFVKWKREKGAARPKTWVWIPNGKTFTCLAKD